MGRLDEDPDYALGDAFAWWCGENGLDPDETSIDDYHEAMAELDPRIGEDEYRRPY